MSRWDILECHDIINNAELMQREQNKFQRIKRVRKGAGVGQNTHWEDLLIVELESHLIGTHKRIAIEIKNQHLGHWVNP